MKPASAPSSRRRVYAVSELLGGLNALLEDRVGRVWVMGEISGLSRPRSGHVYFTLGDAQAKMRAALFRSAAGKLPFEPRDGLEVMVYADVSIYDKRGELQLIVRKLEPRGQGALQLAFEQLRQRLADEGLFEAERKRPLPTHPRRVGIVTSTTGAAVRDVIEVSAQRFPATPLLIAPSRVQGEGVEHELVGALEKLSTQPEIDVVLLVRGGGSLEDLRGFNSELLARAIARCPVPVITGVGHETDFTIADLVADHRSPTPSAAAAAALPDRSHLRQELGRTWRQLSAAIKAQVTDRREQLARESEVMMRLAPSLRVLAQRRRLVSARRALLRAGARQVELQRAVFAELMGRLHSLSPLAVLARGYALVQRESGGTLLRRAADVSPGDRIIVRLSSGELGAVVDERSLEGAPE